MKKFNGKVLDEVADSVPVSPSGNEEISQACNRFLESRGQVSRDYLGRNWNGNQIARVPRHTMSRFRK